MASATVQRDIPHPTRREIRLGSVLHALSDPIRMQMVRELANPGVELPCSAFDVPVTKSTATHHFRVLREAGVIEQAYQGTTRMSGLRRDDLDTLFPGLLDTILEADACQSGRLGLD